MKKFFYLSGLLFFAFNFTQAQYIRCATYELQQKNMEKDSLRRAYYEHIGDKMKTWTAQNKNNAERTTSTNSTIVVPVVVHIVWNTDEQNISDAQVQSQIQVLNEDYAGNNANRIDVPEGFQSRYGNVNINFCLATRTSNGDWTTGIERRQTSTTSFNWGDVSVKYTSSGGLDAWDETQYLNIWVCNLYGGLLGYTQMPGAGPAAEDGCVVFYQSFGRGSSFSLLSQYNLGRTATHEIGHWLGLFHVWGDDGGACYGTDYIDDTPDQANCTFGCPSYPDIDSCAYSEDVDGCPGDPHNGILFMDYMDYSDDDCMSMFTVDQVAVMRGVLNDTSSQWGRSTILTSVGCSAPTGIAQINAATYIGLSPNPANDNININFRLPATTVLTVTAFDLLGKKLISSDVYKTGEQNISMDVSTLSSGLYILVLNTDQGNISKRFSVVR